MKVQQNGTQWCLEVVAFEKSRRENFRNNLDSSLPTVTCSKSTVETLEEGVKYV